MNEQMLEEIKRALRVVPQALMLSLLINGLLRFSVVIALMFCIGDLEAALAAEKTVGYPFIEIFLHAVNSPAGVCLMVAIVIFMGICSLVGDVATSSRILWSFARDKGPPFWRLLSRVRPPSLT